MREGSRRNTVSGPQRVHAVSGTVGILHVVLLIEFILPLSAKSSTFCGFICGIFLLILAVEAGRTAAAAAAADPQPSPSTTKQF